MVIDITCMKLCAHPIPVFPTLVLVTLSETEHDSSTVPLRYGFASLI